MKKNERKGPAPLSGLAERSNFDVTVKILDYSHAAPSGDLQKLKKHTTFKVPGAQFSQLYKSGKWDGYVSLIKRGKVPVGLIPYILARCEKARIRCGIIAGDSLMGLNDFCRDVLVGPGIDDSILSVVVEKLPDYVVRREYQFDALESALGVSRGLILMPTGTGKSLTMYLLATLLSAYSGSVLLIVPRIELVDQMAQDFRSYSKGACDPLTSTMDGFSGLSKVSGLRRIFISTFHSWLNWAENTLSFIPGAVIFDEAHTVAQKSLPWNLMDTLTETKYRYGFTATEPEQTYDKLVLQGLAGPVCYRDRPEERIEDGTLARPIIRRISLMHREVFDKTTVTWKRSRMSVISLLIREMIPDDKALLILTDTVDTEMLPLVSVLKTVLTDSDIFHLTRMADRDERSAIKAIMNQPRRRTVLCATYGLFQMGINIPTLEHVMLYAPSGSSIRVLQSIGRVMRQKSRCFVYDLIDVHKDQNNSLAEKRMTIYNDAYGSQFSVENMVLGVD